MAATFLAERQISNTEPVTRKVSMADRRESFIADVHKALDHELRNEKPFVAKNITPYQVEKLRSLFEKYYDVDKDGIITDRDIEALNEKFVDFTGWNPDDPKLHKLLEYHRDVFKCILMEINKDVLIEEHKTNDIPLNSWLKMWDRIMKGALAVSHLPQWVQVMPYNLFTYIDRNGENHITKDDLLAFYTDFMLLDDKKAKTVADNAWVQMTGNGDFKLTLELYTMSFANFLFGKSFYGPGLFILGTFRECSERIPFRAIPPLKEQ
jgi:Ca2+-binding EF-hand superfamily protein